MEHFKRFAFCMLYLFTFIWQLSAQVKKIPQWERFEIVLQGTAKGNPFADASLTATFWQQGGDTVNVQGFYDGDGRYVIRFMPINPGVWYYSIDSNIASLARKHPRQYRHNKQYRYSYSLARTLSHRTFQTCHDRT